MTQDVGKSRLSHAALIKPTAHTRNFRGAAVELLRGSTGIAESEVGLAARGGACCTGPGEVFSGRSSPCKVGVRVVPFRSFSLKLIGSRFKFYLMWSGGSPPRLFVRAPIASARDWDRLYYPGVNMLLKCQFGDRRVFLDCFNQQPLCTRLSLVCGMFNWLICHNRHFQTQLKCFLSS